MPTRVGRGADRSASLEQLARVAWVNGPFASEFDPARGLRGELGELARDSGRMLNARSHAQINGAENLLTKAVRSLTSGDPKRAEKLIRRAAQMPYDPREEGSPGVRAASLLVYRLLSDQFEASDYHDTTWLDVVLEVHPRLDTSGRAEVASVVHGFVLQEPFFDVSAAEKRRIQQHFGDAPLEAELGDGPDSTVQRREDVIRSLVEAAVALNTAYSAAAKKLQ